MRKIWEARFLQACAEATFTCIVDVEFFCRAYAWTRPEPQDVLRSRSQDSAGSRPTSHLCRQSWCSGFLSSQRWHSGRLSSQDLCGGLQGWRDLDPPLDEVEVVNQNIPRSKHCLCSPEMGRMASDFIQSQQSLLTLFVKSSATHMGLEGVLNRKKTPIFFVDAK